MAWGQACMLALEGDKLALEMECKQAWEVGYKQVWEMDCKQAWELVYMRAWDDIRLLGLACMLV